MKISDMIQLTKQIKELTSSIKARKGTIQNRIEKSDKVIKAMSQKREGNK
jgi:uncharacterized protein YukE